jgi:GWxTD domain-containing protein
VVFGRDTLIPVYVESYGPGELAPLAAVARSENTPVVLWSDTVTLRRRASLFSGVINVPVARIGVGVISLLVKRLDTGDSTKGPLFVSFGEDLPVASFADMLSYLRYFTGASRLQALRDATPEERAAAWAKFLRETDPDPGTPQHEALRDYFGRIAQANARFREEGSQGWLSDRGRVFVSLGQPDQIYEPPTTDTNQRGRALFWDYQRFRLRVVFIDQTGFGRWRMTISSESEFEAVLRREITR